MSSQKEKYLASAQKFIQKGQFERALRDYEQVVAADPKDVKHRQKLAELMVRCSRKDDAIREYESIAKYYDENGFFLKAIAVYKQIQRLDPSNISISLCLAALNEKQGMIGNALSEYKFVFDHYEKSGELTEAIKILEKMQAVDPENVDIRLKLAETLFAADMTDKAYHEFTRSVLALRNRGNDAFADRVSRKIRELFPDRGEAGIDILAEQVAGGLHEQALPQLRQLLENDPENLGMLALLAKALQLSGAHGERVEVLKNILRQSPGDVAAIQGLVESTVAVGDIEESLAVLHRYQNDLFAAGAYGAVEQYYTTLQAAAPYDVRLLEGLKNLYEVTGESSKLSDVQVSLNILSQESEAASTESIGEEIPLCSDSGVAGIEAPSLQEISWGDEIDLTAMETEVDVLPEEPDAAGSAEYGTIDLSGGETFSAGNSLDGLDLDISFELPDTEESAPDPAQSETSLQPGGNSTDSAVVSSEGDHGSSWVDEIDLSAMDALEIETPGDSTSSGPVEFGTVDLAPGPSADELTRSEDFEIDVSFDLPDGSDIFATEHQESAETIAAIDEMSVSAEFDVVPDMGGSVESVVAEAPGAGSDAGDEFDFLREDAAVEESQVVSAADSVDEVDEHAREEAPSFIEPVISLIEELPEEPAPLSTDEPAPLFQSDELAGSDKYDFDGQFAKFKEELDQQVDSGDTETHYNLGIAYMEMGLYDDAIKEFSSAGSDPNRKLDCLTLKGVCNREKGDFAAAEHCIVSALALDGLNTDRILDLRYELALLYEASGRKDEALQSFREVFSINPGFRDTMNRIAVLSGQRGSFDLTELDDVDIELETLE